MKHGLAFLTVTIAASWFLAETARAQSDFYIRSLYANGRFTGSHEILTEPRDGYYAARYCDQTFWVSSGTVVWTEEQASAGRLLVLEENTGPERRIVCQDYAAFATLDDLGLKPREIEKIRNSNQSLDMKSGRIRTIRDAFKHFK